MMDTAADIINNNVDLESYSSSKLFLGFFERKKTYSTSIVKNAINLFFDRLIDPQKPVHVISSLFVDEDFLTLPESYKADLFNRKKRLLTIHEMGLIKLIKGTDDESFPSSQLDLLSKSWNSIIIHDYVRIKRALANFLLTDGIQGHIFIVLEDKSVIAYPHNDETGFGFIGYNFDASEKTKRFLALEKLLANDDFRFIDRHRYIQ